MKKDGCPNGTIPIPNTARTKNICVKPKSISKTLDFLERRIEEEKSLSERRKGDRYQSYLRSLSKSVVVGLFEHSNDIMILNFESIKRSMLKK